MKHSLIAAVFCLTLPACNFSCSSTPIAKPAIPHFDENIAYAQILDYEKFGPKVPGTDAHVKAGDWIVAELKKTNATVQEQKSTAVTFDHHTIPIRNIIAQINPEAKDRYFFSAHWDNRPFADEDPDPKYRNTPVPGVNDGGSGVVVLLGMAKALSGLNLPFGVDLVFFDAEDWGNPRDEESYCLGTQYWAKNPIPANYKAKFGVNFDMVGRMGSVFPIESYSAEKAPEVLSKMRAAAKKLGFEELFPDNQIGAVVDDHVYVMQGRGFPVADLIAMTGRGRFPPEWHTHKDTSEFISRDVLKAVGQTMIQMLWDLD